MKNNQYKLTTTNRISSRQRLVMFLLVLLMIPLFFVSRNIIVGFSQTENKSEKKITKESFKNEPIEIIDISSNEKSVELEENFVQKNDWLKDFTIKFKNVSGKSIVYVSTAIDFPGTDSTGNRMSFSLKYGVHPLVEKNANVKLELLAPNDMAELYLSAERYETLKNFLATRQHLLKDLTETHLTIVTVYFDDGTHWSAGTIYSPDPNRPGKFVAIDKNNQEEEK